jgi:SAM-dependent MidA family methyltransferase
MEDIIKQIIHDSPLGWITYADFIETALYHPEHGYYMKEGEKIGREGDFITTSNVSDLYGAMMAKWFAKIVMKYGLPAAVCEIGAGTGRFAQSFIDEWNRSMKIPLSYTMVEGSPFHRKLQKEKIQTYENVTQVENIDDVKSFEGLLFSNELFDALPVHVIQKRGNTLYEVMVSVKDGQFVEVMEPLMNQKILGFLFMQNLELNDGQRLEIPLSMVNLIHSLSNVLLKGISVTVDYGYTNEEWMEPARKNGSLRGYYRHHMIENILENPGKMDITSHVHFDALINIGNKMGLSYIDKLRQDEFFLSIGILKELQDHYDPNPFSERSKRNRAIRSLIMPSGISPSFRVILQHKEMPSFETDWFKK